MNVCRPELQVSYRIVERTTSIQIFPSITLLLRCSTFSRHYHFSFSTNSSFVILETRSSFPNREEKTIYRRKKRKEKKGREKEREKEKNKKSINVETAVYREKSFIRPERSRNNFFGDRSNRSILLVSSLCSSLLASSSSLFLSLSLCSTSYEAANLLESLPRRQSS